MRAVAEATAPERTPKQEASLRLAGRHAGAGGVGAHDVLGAEEGRRGKDVKVARRIEADRAED